MYSSGKRAELVLRLFTKSNSSSLEWKPSVKEDTFQVSFKDYTVIIAETAASFDEVDIKISIWNDSGEIVETFTDRDLANVPTPNKTTWFSMMSDMFEMARRHVRGADKALDALLEEIGDDDLPF